MGKNDQLAIATLKAAGHKEAAALVEAVLGAATDQAAGDEAVSAGPEIGQVLEPAAAPSGTPAADAPGPPGAPLTIEQVKKMEPAEINSRWPEVQKVLAAQGAS